MTTTGRTMGLGLCLVLTAGQVDAAEAGGRARLRSARWAPEAGAPPGSEVSEDGTVLTTRLGDTSSDLVAHARLEFDTTRGNDGMLSFLSTHPWVRCEAPDGLVVGDTGTVAVVCRAEARKLARVKKRTRVYLKADPPADADHKKFYWVLLPAD